MDLHDRNERACGTSAKTETGPHVYDAADSRYTVRDMSSSLPARNLAFRQGR